MRGRALPPILLGLTILLSRPAPAVAQARIEVGPVLGVYLPAGSFQPAPYYSTALPSDPSDMTGLAWGAEGRVWIGPRFGLQLGATVASSRVGGGATPVGVLAPTSVRVLTGSVQALYNLQAGRRTHLWVSGGVGVVRHGGQAYTPYGSPTQLTGVLGVGSSIPLQGQLRLTLGLITQLYSLTVRDSAARPVQRGFQVDAVPRVGIAWAWR
jgi:hypothetical protein